MSFKKRVSILLALVLTFSIIVTVSARTFEFWVDDIGPEQGVLKTIPDDKLKSDIEIVRGIANQYADKYAVRQLEYLDCSPITSDDPNKRSYIYNMNNDVSVKEMDSMTHEVEFDRIFDTTEHRDFVYKFRSFVTPCGLEAEFEPSCYFEIYRNVYLVGGYMDYSGSNLQNINIDVATDMAVANIEARTREKVSAEGKKTLRKEINDLVWKINNDTGLRVFVIVADAVYDKYGEVVFYSEEPDKVPARLEAAYIFN